MAFAFGAIRCAIAPYKPVVGGTFGGDQGAALSMKTRDLLLEVWTNQLSEMQIEVVLSSNVFNAHSKLVGRNSAAYCAECKGRDPYA